MTIHDIPNIEHCTIETIGAVAYRLFAHEGWYIYLPNSGDGEDDNGNPIKIYKTVVIISQTYDFSLVEITAEADLPPNIEICGDTGNDPEVM